MSRHIFQKVASSRMRGLKRGQPPGVSRKIQGRILADAWIETIEDKNDFMILLGRILADAWIETLYALMFDLYSMVASSRMRGLKHQ